MHPLKVYLAGPEVFLNNAKEIGEKKKALCRKYQLEGIFPIDVEIETKEKSPQETGLTISKNNESLINSSQIVIANITPFRGPSADVGTVYEMGYAHALGKIVLAYTNVATPFTERTVKALKGKVKRDSKCILRDNQDMFIEENCLTDNLMIDGCINANSKILVVENAPTDQLFVFLNGFEKCLVEAQKIVNKKTL